MTGGIMECLASIKKPSKNNLTQHNKNSKSSFDQIFSTNRKEIKLTENNNVSRRLYKNTNEKVAPLYNQKIIKDKIDNKHEVNSCGCYGEHSDANIEKGLIAINEDQIDNVVDENDMSLSSEEMPLDLIAINELLSSFISTYMNSELVNCDDKMDNDVLHNKTSSSEIFAISSELNNIIPNIEHLLELLSKLDLSDHLELKQEIQAITDIIDNGKLEKMEPSAVNELKAHMDDITQSIQNLTESFNDVNQSSTDGVKSTDDKKHTTTIYDENEDTVIDPDGNKSKIRTEHLMDSKNTIKENIDIPKGLNNFITDQSMKSNGQTNELFEVVTNTNKTVNEAFTIDKNSIFEQMVDKIKVDYKDIRDEIKIKLKPEVLGEMTIKVVVEKGIVTAKAIVETYHIKQLLDSNVEQLKDSFREQGISFNALDVSVNKDSDFNRNNAEAWDNSKKTKNRKVKVGEIKLNNIYEEVNVQNTNNLSVYHNGLDLIV